MNSARRATEIPLLRKALYLLLPWFFVMLAFEVIARGFFSAPSAAKPMFGLTMCEADPQRVWRYKANYRQRYSTDEFDIAIETNSWGLRDREIRVGEGSLRVLVIGDSFTFGWGVEAGKRYSEVLAQRLGPRVQVLNAGHWLYTFDQQLVVLRELLPRFRPHLVVQGVYPGHVLSIDEHEWVRGEGGEIERIGYRDWWNVILVAEDGSLRRSNPLIESPPLRSRFVAKLAQRFFRAWQIERETRSPADLYAGGNQLEGAWQKVSVALGQTSSLLRSQGVQHLVFSVPQDASVNDLEWPEYFRAEVNGRRLDLGQPYARFAEAARGSVWLDLRPLFVDAYSPALYFPSDPHWTSAGHELAAEAIAPCASALLRGDTCN